MPFRPTLVINPHGQVSELGSDMNTGDDAWMHLVQPFQEYFFRSPVDVTQLLPPHGDHVESAKLHFRCPYCRMLQDIAHFKEHVDGPEHQSTFEHKLVLFAVSHAVLFRARCVRIIVVLLNDNHTLFHACLD
jgi:hypothetical protein